MKAQFWSLDVIFAIIIFVFALLLLTVVWIDISGELSISYGGNIANMESQLQTLSNQVFSTGNPSNWNATLNFSLPSSWENVSIGLGNGTVGALSLSKINALKTMNFTNYQATKPALGVGYDYYITISGNGYNTSIGSNPSTSNVTADQVVSVPAILNGKAVQVQIQLWSNSTISIE